MAARFWRAVGLETYAGGDLEITELQLYENGVRVDAAATLTCTAAPLTGALTDLKDGLTSAAVRYSAAAVAAPSFSLVWDFGVGVTKDIDGVRLGASTNASLFLGALTLQPSADGVTWSDGVAFGWISYPGNASLTPTPVAGDPWFSNVSLLLHADGANGSTTFTDSSALPKTITPVGGAQISTAQSKFGGAAISLNGTSNYLWTPADATYAPTTAGDFTVEAWIRCISPTSLQRIAGFANSSGGSSSFAFFVAANGSLLFGTYTSTGTPYATGSVADIFANTWHHVAGVKQGATLRTFVDGVQKASAPFTGTVQAMPSRLGIGCMGDYAGQYFGGQIDELRITNGIARYTANFVPPTAAFPNNSSVAAGVVAAPLRLRSAAVTRLADFESPAFSIQAQRPVIYRDMQYGGRGKVTGTVKEKALPANTPLNLRVRLISERDNALVREIWSDPVTGVYEFVDIDPTLTYTVLSYDHLRNYRAVVADNLTPELIP
jgi:hypothetical protein